MARLQTMQLSDKRRFVLFAVLAFLLCFIGVMTGADVQVVDTLALVIGAAIGLSATRTIKRAQRRNHEPNA